MSTKTDELMKLADEYAFMAKRLPDEKIIGPAVPSATHPAAIARAALRAAIDAAMKPEAP